MATTTGVRLTKAGEALLAKIHQGDLKLELTSFVIGDTVWSAEEVAAADHTSLKNERLREPIANIGVGTGVDAGRTICTGVLRNTTITEAFYVREIGILARDPESQEEMLYLIDPVAADAPTSVIESNAVTQNIPIRMELIAVSRDQVELVLTDSAELVTKEELETVTEGIYATLNKLTVDNFDVGVVVENLLDGGITHQQLATAQAVSDAIATATDARFSPNSCAISSVQLGTNANVTSSHSIAIGAYSCVCQAADNSIAIGRDAIAVGGDSIAMGRGAIAGAAGYSYAISMGYRACSTSYGVAIGDRTSASGCTSVAIGGRAIAIGCNSIAIGCTACVTHTSAIGILSFSCGNNTVSFDGRPVYGGAYNNVSDCRDKSDLQPLPIGLAFVRDLRAYEGYYNDRDRAKAKCVEAIRACKKWDEECQQAEIDKLPNGLAFKQDPTLKDARKSTFFVAQQVKDTLVKHGVDYKLFIDTSCTYGSEGMDRQHLTYTDFIPILVKAIQELDEKVEKLSGGDAK